MTYFVSPSKNQINMDKNKVIDLLVELIETLELEEEFLYRLEQKNKVVVGKRADINKLIDEIQKKQDAEDAQNPPDRKPSEEDIRKAIEREIQQEKWHKKGNNPESPKWTMETKLC